MKSIRISHETFNHLFLPATPAQQQEMAGKHTWYTAQGYPCKVNKMTSHHIERVLKCLEGHGQSDISDEWLHKMTPYSRWEWVDILNEELIRRQ